MCCKGGIPIEKNIIVTDENGIEIGSTYPKRAKGLIKSGRAELIGNNVICLKNKKDEKFKISSRPPLINIFDNLEDNINMNRTTDNKNKATYNNNRVEVDVLTGEVLDKNDIESVVNFVDSAEKVMDELTFDSVKSENVKNVDSNFKEEKIPESTAKKLFFLPRKWRFNPEYKNGFGERIIITDMFGKLSEAFCISRWQDHRGEYWTEIQSELLALEKNTDYVFTFWLNGGENDRYQETCRLKIIFDSDDRNCYMYKLNRDIIKPVKRYKGWVLFEIPFTTEYNDYTQLKFEAADAHTAILPALGKEAYANLPDDEIDPRIPQRHNIVFKDGFPRDSSWSYLVFGEKNKQDNKNNNFNFDNFDKFDNFGKNFDDFGKKMNEFGQKMGNMVNDKVNVAMGVAGNVAEKAKVFKETIYNEVYEDLMDEIEDEIKDEVMDEIRDEIKENIKSQVIDEILAKYRNN